MKKIFPLAFLLCLVISCNTKVEIEQEVTKEQPQSQDLTFASKRIAIKELQAFTKKYENKWTDRPSEFPYFDSKTFKVYQLGKVGECNKCEFKDRITGGVEISKRDFNELVHLLDNPKSYSNSTAACFNPKISIIAYDSENVPTEFLSICLNCNNFRSYPGEIQIEHNDEYLTGFSNETRNRLREMFLGWGIDYYGFSSAWDDEEKFLDYFNNKNAPQTIDERTLN